MALPTPTLRKNLVTPTATDQNPVVAQISNTVTRPGALTTEWWTVVIAGAVSTVLAVTGLPGSEAAQVAGIVAPILLALIYVFVRSRTKGALAEVLKAVFPQADDNPPPTSGGGVAAAVPAQANSEANGQPVEVNT